MSGESSGAGIVDRLQAPDRQRIVVGDEAQPGMQPALLHPLGDQHAERLVRVPARRTYSTPCSAASRAGSSRPAGCPGPGSCERQSCTSSHSRTSSGKRAQPARSTSIARTRSARCVVSGRRSAHVARDRRRALAPRGRSARGRATLSTSRSMPAKRKVSPVLQRGGELLLDLAERAAVAEADLDHLGIDDDPGVHPVALRRARDGSAARCRPRRGRCA